MKKTLSILFALAFVSCAKEGADRQNQIMKIRATSEASTRTDLVMGETSCAVNWSAGDEISVCGASATDTYVLSSGAGKSSAEFTVKGSASVTSGDVSVFYPSSLSTSSLIWPSNQAYSEDNASFNPLYGTTTVEGLTSSVNLKSIGGLVQLVLSCSSDIAISTISLAADQGLSGAFTIDGDKAVISENGGIIMMDCNLQSLSSTKKSFFFAVPAKDYTNFYIRITDYRGYVATFKASTFSVGRATVVPVTKALTSESFKNKYGVFSVSPTKKVHIAKGNLMWQASTDTWKFALNQYDRLGAGGGNCVQPMNPNRVNQSEWIDYFNYGCSGITVGSVTLGAHLVAGTDFYVGGVATNELVGSDYNADWGYNKIANGGNENGKWFTPSKEEWQYMMSGAASGTRGAKTWYASSIVAGVWGYIIIPDVFTDPKPNGKTFSSGVAAKDSAKNTYTAAEWLILEDSGCVFYPMCGYRDTYAIKDFDTAGRYHLCSVNTSNTAQTYQVIFTATNAVSQTSGGRTIAKAVRLMRVIE